MVSTTRGTATTASWDQSIDGLENMYVQDISICAEKNDSNNYVAYAATAGGGVFKSTNAFASGMVWTQASINNLPKTLNVDEIEVGIDPDIVYIKIRENDISIKSFPLLLLNVLDQEQEA